MDGKTLQNKKRNFNKQAYAAQNDRMMSCTYDSDTDEAHLQVIFRRCEKPTDSTLLAQQDSIENKNLPSVIANSIQPRTEVPQEMPTDIANENFAKSTKLPAPQETSSFLQK